MKTPHAITLIHKGVDRYNPITDSYEVEDGNRTDVPAFINYVTQAKAFEIYGTRDKRVAIARFSQEQAPFDLAEFDDRLFKPIEQINAPIKGAVRLEEVQDED